ncbi:MAG: DUF4268 domain-containing protein [Acidimicrobiia bacterium]
MPDELLFSVRAAKAERVDVISLAEAGLKERQDLQEWVTANPELLGPGVMIVTLEFDRWKAASGAQPQDRMDVLGLDQDGRLVVAELKRDKAPDTMEMQAIKYAAMASRFTPESVASQLSRFTTSRGRPLSTDEALEELLAHSPDLSIETLRRPKIILLAADFPPVLTAAAVWLTEMGLDMSLIRFQAYQTATEILLSVSRVYPIPDVEEFTIAPQLAEARAARETRTRTRDTSAVRRLVDAGAISEGEPFQLQVRADVNADARAAIEQWVAKEPTRGKAAWQNHASAPLNWEHDGNAYSPTGLAKHIVLEATGLEPALQGTRWWVNGDGDDLTALSAEYAAGKAKFYERFWTRFLERLYIEHPDWVSSKVANSNSWIRTAAITPRTLFGASFASSGRLRLDFYIEAGDAEGSLVIFDHFSEHKAEIETAFGEPLSWEPLPGKKACRIAAYTSGDVLNEAEYEQYIDWFFDISARLRSSLGPFVPN